MPNLFLRCKLMFGGMKKPLSIAILRTGDGTTTLLHEALNETYHSRHGALRESMHVYVLRGFLDQCVCVFGGDIGKDGAALDVLRDGGMRRRLRVFEMGFGTGLNAWLLREVAWGMGVSVDYSGIEKFPISRELLLGLDFDFGGMAGHWALVSGARWLGMFEDCKAEEYRGRWMTLATQEGLACGTVLSGGASNSWVKWNGDVMRDLELAMAMDTDLVFWDAFAPKKQPELWSASLFQRVRSRMSDGGLLVTYTANGEVRRNMIAAGFRVEKVGGPPGKREMLRAWK